MSIANPVNLPLAEYPAQRVCVARAYRTFVAKQEPVFEGN